MPQWKKLLYDHKVSDIEGDVWKFNFYKAALFAGVLLVILILVYGTFFASDKDKFFSDVIFYATVMALGVFALLLISGSIKKFRGFIAKFFIIIVCMIGAYGLIGLVWGHYYYNFYIGYSTWILFVVLAGFGATRNYIFNGHLDRYDVFYCLLVFFAFISANLPMFHGASLLERLDGVIVFFMDKISMLNLGERLNETVNQTG